MAITVQTSRSRVNYFDAHLDNGSSLVIVFHGSNPTMTGGPVDPFVAVRLERPGSQPVLFESHSPVARFNVGSDRCHLLIGDAAIQGDPTCIGGLR